MGVFPCRRQPEVLFLTVKARKVWVVVYCEVRTAQAQYKPMEQQRSLLAFDRDEAHGVYVVLAVQDMPFELRNTLVVLVVYQRDVALC